MTKPTWIDVIEASYQVGRPEPTWLEGILAAAGPLIDRGLGAWAFSYDFDCAGPIRPRIPVTYNLREGDTLETIMVAQADVSPGALAATFQKTTCGTASQLLGRRYEKATTLDRFRNRGVRDSLGINVRDPTTTGCVFIGFLPQQSALHRGEILQWEKVAAHIGAGFRLQRRTANEPNVGTEGAEAVLTPSGRVVHAEVEAKGANARADLRDAVRAIELARTKRGRQSDDAVERWKGLVSRRWSFVEHFEVDGRRYFLARENAPVTAWPFALANRETQVLSYAVLGHSNKLIAYELGIAASTVRVLLTRAAGKLGTSKRAETLRVFTAMSRAAAHAAR